MSLPRDDATTATRTGPGPGPGPDLELGDGTPVRFLLTPAEGARLPDPGAGPGDDRPPGLGRAVPVASGRRAAVDLAEGALRGALRPLGPLLQEVHDAATAVPRPPAELSVTFGVQVGHDLKFGIVGASGQAHLTVTASWKPDAEPGAASPAASGTASPAASGTASGTASGGE
ncbi:CU044_2847 family protein [Streptomyces sp. NPDC003374]